MGNGYSLQKNNGAYTVNNFYGNYLIASLIYKNKAVNKLTAFFIS